MAEIRLICPGCGAEYRLPADAIPAQGREVECTACGRAWHASGIGTPMPDGRTTRPEPEQMSYTMAFGPSANVRREGAPSTIRPQSADEASDDTAPPPAAPLSRRVPESVLSILRDEVEHERRARAAETGAEGGAETGAETGASTDTQRDTGRRTTVSDAEVEWPATTVTDGPAVEAKPGPVAEPPAPAPERDKTVTPPDPDPVLETVQQVVPAGATRAMVGAPAPQPDPAADLDLPGAVASTDVRAAPPVQPAAPLPSAGPSGYRMGFGLAAMIATTGLVLYLLAPGMSDAGPVGEALGGFRQFVDQGRQWLQTSVGSLFG